MKVTNYVRKKAEVIEDILFKMYEEGYFGYVISPSLYEEERALLDKLSLTELCKDLYHP